MLLQDVRHHCAALEPLQYKLAGGSYTRTKVFTGLNATTTYEVTVRATNNWNRSTEASGTIKTGELSKLMIVHASNMCTIYLESVLAAVALIANILQRVECSAFIFASHHLIVQQKSPAIYSGNAAISVMFAFFQAH